MKDKNYLSTLQDKYHERMIKNGYNLDRGIKNSDNEQLSLFESREETLANKICDIFNSFDIFKASSNLPKIVKTSIYAW